MKALARRLIGGIKNALAFLATVVLGIVFGCFYCTTETIEEKLKPRHHSAVKQNGHSGHPPPAH